MTTNTYILLNRNNGEKRIIRATGKGKALKYARGQITAIKANVEEVLALIDKGIQIEVASDKPTAPSVDKRQVDFINEKLISTPNS